jgi:hypothetical protein
MNISELRAQVTRYLQHPKAPLAITLFVFVVLLVLFLNWWQWQIKAQQGLVLATTEQQQLQSLIAQLPSNAALVTGSEAMMATLSRTPLPASLQGKVVDIRIVNDQLKGQIVQANASELFSWLNQLSQAGLLVSRLDVTKTEAGLLSGALVWGQ